MLAKFFKKCCKNFIANTQASDIIASGSVTKSCNCITKGLEKLQFLNFHDCTISNSFHKQSHSQDKHFHVNIDETILSTSHIESTYPSACYYMLWIHVKVGT